MPIYTCDQFNLGHNLKISTYAQVWAAQHALKVFMNTNEL